MRLRTQTATLLVVMVGCAGAAMGAAFGIAGDDGEPSHIPSRAELYREGMSLEAIAKAASGRPGEIAPACPDEKTVDALKDADVEFGPCDPAPEHGEAVRLPDDEDQPSAEADEVCPGVILGKGVDLTIQLPCAVGAQILDARAVKRDDSYCAEITYVEKTGARPRTETLCEGDVPAIGGPPVRGPKTASNDESNHAEDGHTHEHG